MAQAKVAVPLLLLVILLAAGAFYLMQTRYESISEIVANPAKYAEEEVSVKGRVVEAIPISLPMVEYTGAYALSEENERIWVATRGQVPKEGEVRAVRGTVKTGVTVMGRNIGVVIMEQEPDRQ
jgi:hypothetical protein